MYIEREGWGRPGQFRRLDEGPRLARRPEHGWLGGQNKVLRIVNDETLLADLRTFAKAHRAV